jgi:hypothetical protein
VRSWFICTAVPPWHRAYVRSHWVGLSVAVGVCLSGLIGLIAPEAVEQSASAVVLPRWAVTMLNVSWVVGGASASVGLLRGNRQLHVPGMSLIGGGLLAYYSAILALRPEAAWQVVFIAILGVGCLLHATFLALYGYSGTEKEFRHR